MKILIFTSYSFIFSLKMFLRYPLNSVITLVVMTMLFIGLFQTAIGIVGMEGDLNIEYIVQRFVLWATMIMGFASISSSVRDGTLSGIMETVWMSPFPAIVVMVIRSLISLLINFAMMIVLMLILSSVFQTNSTLTYSFLLSTATITVSALGVGLIVAAAVVVFKGIGPLVNLLQFAMLPIFMNDPERWGNFMANILPGLPALHMLRSGAFSLPAAINAILWLLIGCIVFMISVRVSRRRGLVYQY